MSLTVPEITKHPCATCEDGLANKPGGICGECFMDGKIAPADDEAFVDPLPEGHAPAAPSPVRCRIAGCDAVATHHLGARGLYANTCDVHYDLAVARARKPTRPARKPARVKEKPAVKAAPVAKPGGLVAAAERVEAARAACEEARQRFEEARAELVRLAQMERPVDAA